jgi:pimeloyl-ACP methyl ester carboxylesterase
MNNILMLHGELATRNQFDTILPQLSQSFDAHAINFTGHGGLNIPTYGYSFKTFANDILAFADKHQIEKLNLFGYSMGGYAALYFAKLYPDRVERIFTLNVKFNWDPTTTAKQSALFDAEKMIHKVPGYANQLIMLHGLNLWKDVIENTAQMLQKLTEDYLLTPDDFASMQLPVLLAIGDKDTISSIEETLQVYRKLLNARMWVIPETHHSFDKVNPSILVEEIKNFFAIA